MSRILVVVFFSAWFLTTHSFIDHAAIAEHAQSINSAYIKKQQLSSLAIKVSAATLCGCLAYYMYGITAQNTTYVLNVPIELVQEYKESPLVIKKALEQYVSQKNSFMNSSMGSAVKLTGSLLCQSLLVQALHPVYNYIQRYFSSNVWVLPSCSWFLSEQLNDVNQEKSDKKIEIDQELYTFVMQVESLEYGYTQFQADLIAESAQVILSHVMYVKEYDAPYLYQKRLLQKSYDALSEIIESMVSEAHNTIFDQSNLDSFKNQIRALRKVPAYSII